MSTFVAVVNCPQAWVNLHVTQEPCTEYLAIFSVTDLDAGVLDFASHFPLDWIMGLFLKLPRPIDQKKTLARH